MAEKVSRAGSIKQAAPDEQSRQTEIKQGVVEDIEVFAAAAQGGGVNFRTLSWPVTAIIYLKILFSTGVLSIPSSMATLGAVGGTISVIGWTLSNIWGAIIMGGFRSRHTRCHTVADMAYIVGGPALKEVIATLFLLNNIIAAGSVIITISTALNALSYHATCTVWFALVAAVAVAACASIRRLEKIGWLTWLGFGLVFVAVFIVVVAATVQERPASAPQTGPFDLGFYAFPLRKPTFSAAMVASCAIFCSSGGITAFVPVMAEMRQPKDYNKAVLTSMGFVLASFMTFSLVMYAYCGTWVASPSLGSAGQTIKMVAYGISLPGMVVTACLYVHVASKYAFVRLLRDTPHLQANSVTHWATWFAAVIAFTTVAFVLAQAIPIFNHILSLLGSLINGPLNIMFPAYLWLYEFTSTWRRGTWQKAHVGFHAFWFMVGIFIMVAGTYATCVEIKHAYATGRVGSAFSCADNSNSAH